MRAFLESLLFSYLGGFLLIILGVWMIRCTIKNPQLHKGSPLQGDMNGWAAGVIGIGMGLLIIIMKILNKI